MHTPPEIRAMSAPLAAALAGTAFAVPLALSASSSPSPNHPATLLWYSTLREPAFKPPDWVIPAAWGLIEAALAAAAYRLLRARPSAARTKALALWGWNVFMIGGWSRLFFKRHALGVSTVAAASMVATSAAFVKAAAPVDKTAARAGIPLVAWLTFATALTGSIWYLNSRRR
jgi:tryptophan-rich sensory protein